MERGRHGPHLPIRGHLVLQLLFNIEHSGASCCHLPPRHQPSSGRRRSQSGATTAFSSHHSHHLRLVVVVVVLLTLLIALLILTQNVMRRVQQVLIADCLACQSSGSAFSCHDNAPRLPCSALITVHQVTVHRFLLPHNIFLGLPVDYSTVDCSKGRNGEVRLRVSPPLIDNQRGLGVDVDLVWGG